MIYFPRMTEKPPHHIFGKISFLKSIRFGIFTTEIEQKFNFDLSSTW